MSRADTSEVENLDGWLTTVVARVRRDRAWFPTATSTPSAPAVDAFLAAARDGAAAVARGATRWMTSFARRELVMRPVLINGAVGVVTTLDGEPFSVGGLTVRGGRIVAIDILADPERLGRLDLTILDR